MIDEAPLPTPKPPARAALRPLALLAGCCALVAAGFFLTGWLLHLHTAAWLGYRMKTNSALGLALLSTALAVRAIWPRSRAASALAALAAMLGAATLLEYGTGLDLRLDQLLARDFPAAETAGFPNRMAPTAAVNLLLLALATNLLSARRPARAIVGQLGAAAALALDAVTLVGYLYDATALYQPTAYIRMSPYTAGIGMVLALGLLTLRPDLGLGRLFASRGPGGFLARRLIGPAIAAPLVVGWLMLESERTGRHHGSTGTAALVLLTTAVFTWLVVALARTLDRIDVRRRRAEGELRQAGALTAALASAATVEEVVEVAVHVGLPALGASAGGVMLLSEDGQQLNLASSSGYAPSVTDAFRTIAESGDTPAARAAHDGIAIFLESPAENERQYPGLLRGSSSRNQSWAALPLRGTDRMLGVLCLSYAERQRFDDAERERLAQLARQCSQALERALLFDEREAANRAKDEFMAMLGHELRNPLSPILTALQIMKLRDREAHQNERAIVERQVQHMARLVDDLLDVSRITRGKIQLDRRRVELRDVVAQAVEVASPLFEERVHNVDIDAPAGLAVQGDEHRLTQVLSNLLTNAAKYTEPGGHIRVSARPVGDHAELAVTDDGVGIPPELLPRVFDLFTQGYRAPDRSSGGLGLGLAIVRRLVEMHGGTVEASSAGRGQGATFTVRLPADRSLREQVTEPIPAPERPTGKHRVLVVDDNRDAAETLCEALEMEGHQTRVAFDGPSALAIAAEFRPELGFLDIGLPVMDGYELARRLRALELEPLTLVAITGYGQPSDRARSAEAGFDDHLVKPISLDTALAIADHLPMTRPAPADERTREWG